ncbi:MAG: ABC transporter ATP-binding protein, partial [Akkermansia sp.]|nr:ABC transporter ATP-binding protein [Akkermansia sp.]
MAIKGIFKSEQNLLEVRNLTVAFKTENGLVRAIDDVSFDVPRGKCVGIVGESGCGKSITAMSLVRLLPQPAAKILRGRVMFDGEDVLNMPYDRLRELRDGEVGVIFQEPLRALNPVHRIGDQIAETLMLHRGLTYEAALKEAVEMLRYVHIPDPELRVHEYPMSLSGGMRQRVVIAIALACRPKLIIADEATTALDVTVQQ